MSSDSSPKLYLTGARARPVRSRAGTIIFSASKSKSPSKSKSDISLSTAAFFLRGAFLAFLVSLLPPTPKSPSESDASLLFFLRLTVGAFLDFLASLPPPTPKSPSESDASLLFFLRLTTGAFLGWDAFLMATGAEIMSGSSNLKSSSESDCCCLELIGA